MAHDSTFEDRSVLVTGASRGIGAATARAFGRRGAAVVVNYHQSEEAAHEVAESIEASGGEAEVVGANVASTDEAEHLVDTSIDTFGKLDVVVSNAGVTIPKRFHELDDETLETVIDTNLKGAFHITRPASRHLVEQGKGAIVFISSIAAQMGTVDAAYSASKAGLLGMMRALARELGPEGVRVNAISPGPVSTELGDDILAFLEEQQFHGHENLDTFLEAYEADPEQVAEAAVYLADAEFVTGENLTLNGGMYLD